MFVSPPHVWPTLFQVVFVQRQCLSHLQFELLSSTCCLLMWVENMSTFLSHVVQPLSSSGFPLRLQFLPFLYQVVLCFFSSCSSCFFLYIFMFRFRFFQFVLSQLGIIACMCLVYKRQQISRYWNQMRLAIKCQHHITQRQSCIQLIPWHSSIVFRQNATSSGESSLNISIYKWQVETSFDNHGDIAILWSNITTLRSM